jgi:hypothetical protein
MPRIESLTDNGEGTAEDPGNGHHRVRRAAE